MSITVGILVLREGTEMADKMTILVGTVGQGIMRSGDSGETWQRVSIDQGNTL